MAGFHFSVTFALLTLLCADGLAFLTDSKKLTYNIKLTLEPKYVTRAHSENVRLRCEPGKTQTVTLERFTMMRILKQDPSDATGTTWLPIAQKNNVEVKDAVLEFVWAVATADTFGVYHCDVIGFTSDASIVTGNTPNIEIKMGGVTANDLLDVLMKSKARLQDKVANNSAEIGELNGQFEYLKEQEQNMSDLIGQRLAASENAMDTVMQRLLFPKIAWPSGQYALLQPDTGCPMHLNFYAGHTGYFTLHAESTTRNGMTKANPNSHLVKPVVTTSGNDVFVNLKFCVSSSATTGFPWPKGDYCIHSMTGDCPAGFSRGTINVDTENSANKDAMGGNHPASAPYSLKFCCTNTGVYSTPMVLPTESPFYLYRYKSPCQVVAGMRVQVDYFEVGVEANYNSVSGEYPYTILKSTSRRFELCYYSKQ
ncbi:MACPF domain-containing protein 2 [Elysia marginata]|uniref:MACPF domain-containing protein 2 n=1 Tax=Elysia marginata TaxID=1093978 RepID=A0AAV4JU82_9GAST|nr:MACPF domain-containing protein 2 [Elysia marginata]